MKDVSLPGFQEIFIVAPTIESSDIDRGGNSPVAKLATDAVTAPGGAVILLTVPIWGTHQLYEDVCAEVIEDVHAASEKTSPSNPTLVTILSRIWPERNLTIPLFNTSPE